MEEVMNNRHAYLIVAHHRPDLLALLLEALDDPRNDVYLHIDRKAGKDMDPARFTMEKSRLITIPPISVNWAGPSQVRCELDLLETAVAEGPYDRYHLMTGASYPLKTQDEIHQFFDDHREEEYLEINERNFEERLKYRWLFNEGGKAVNESVFKLALRYGYVRIQKLVGLDHLKPFGMECRKGFAYWSITNELAAYTVERRDLILDMTRGSVCGDEVFLQTIAWNGPLRERLYDEDGVNHGCGWVSTWGIESDENPREGHNFVWEDLDYILSSGARYALKFEGPDGPALIREIRKRTVQEK